MTAPTAIKHKGRVNFVHADATNFGGHVANLGLKEEE